ncbi:GGDEF domain-containing phosphodiesterase [Beggiatoa leptomitoformis]|uniref:cyclic-guanylate-specific phosphodiesterase n=1 Tax=Beggiatoa leptomitoformis TaxID=288004 RepID=A0A2N9YCP2_9GAMM|nr:GGDEF domain-containing phosphodiesterase [Beggiatoa leptomitoformis]AUI68238.1 EAL domain-containing protein [Beggiatoa leptomitoformis]QGX03433.1 EAL domain-containing protein [Beggiatoa leptomitoformis]
MNLNQLPHDELRLQLLDELKQLYEKLSTIEQDKQDLTIALDTTTEHSDLVTQELLIKLHEFRQQLEKFESEKQGLYRDKADLEISLDTITETTDIFQQDLLNNRQRLEAEIDTRTQELERQNHCLQLEVQERKKIEAQLHLAASVFQASREGIIITDSHANIISVNQAYTDITGYTEAECLGENPRFMTSGKHPNSFYQRMWESILTIGHWSGEIWNRRKSKEVYPAWLSISAVKNERKEITHFVGIVTDNSLQKRSEEKIKQLAYYDALTGLPNRLLFQENLTQVLKRAYRENHRVALLLINIDGFKDINDALGHPVGDQVLCHLGKCLTHTLEHEAPMIARMGGDEFAVLLDNLERIQDEIEITAHIATRILSSLNHAVIIEGHEIFLSISIGIAIYPQDGTELSNLLKNVDIAKYEAKSKGRNSYRFFTKNDNAEAHKRLTLQNALRYALEREELFLCYQPLLEANTQKITGVEALLRWQHPTFGLISPIEFIPLAEESGLIIPIGEWVLETACRQSYQWQQQGLMPIRMAVNLSVRQFNQPDLIERIVNVLKQTGLSPHWLKLEITESLAMNCATKTVQTLKILKSLGVHLAIDDFGTGYSSLSYLKQFNLDILKIDRSFIADMSTQNDITLVTSLIKMAHGLNMQVVAEGVETEQQFNLLRANGCDFVQGFFFYKPLVEKEMTQLLQRCRS